MKHLILASAIVASCLSASLKPLGPPCPQGDGYYAVGCNQHYLHCVNGIEYEEVCPEGLFFDRLLSRCERQSDNKLCKVKKGKFADVRHKALVIDCKSKSNGDYALEEGKCDENYYQCANGMGYIRKCPYEQFYTSSSQRCDYWKNCISSTKSRNGVKMNAAGAHAAYPDDDLVVESEEVPVVPNGIDCELLGNATISDLPCSSHFWQCANGKLFRKKCPAGLIFDLDENLCEYAEKKKGCPQYKGVENNDVGAPAPPPSADDEAKTEKPEESKTAFGFVCNSTDDGFFALGFCQRSFASCFGGVSREIVCADHLVYDPRINACDYPLACESERKQEDVPNLFNHGGAAQKPNETIIEIPRFNCSKMPDGYYTETPCIQEYIHCVNRVAIVMKCPSDLVFNSDKIVCDFVENCNKPSTVAPPSPPTVIPSTVETYGQEIPETETTQITTTVSTSTLTTQSISLDDFSCADLTNGNYASGLCQNAFFQCWNNFVTESKCPTTLVFNPYQGQCDYKSNLIDCPEFLGQKESTDASLTKTSTTTTPTTLTTTTSESLTATLPTRSPATTQAPVAEVREHIEPFCERLSDGTYSLGCSAIFFKCENFETIKNRCPEGLYFNAREGKCDISYNIPECVKLGYGTAPATTTEATSEETEATTESTTEIEETTVAEDDQVEATTTATAGTEKPSIDFTCLGRADGIYSLPYCSSDYVQCVHGKPLIASCVNGLHYSEITGLCDYKERVPNCNGKQPQLDTIDKNACVGKSDGYYSNGCSSQYFSCIEEKARKMVCPSKLKFSTKKGICDYPKDVEECEIASAPAQAPPAVANDFCEGKNNGLHEMKACSAHYVVCENNIAITGTCATPLIFNPTTELCDYKSNNPQCAY